MAQAAPTMQTHAVPAAPASPRVWGLDACAIHDAYWAARGVQCVRCGEREPLQAAELYLLIDPGQLVLFDIARISNRLMWHNALVTRVRLIDETAEAYSEHVRVDEHGLVERIERSYQRSSRRAHRIVLTSRKRLAARWGSADSRRAGWKSVRGSVPWSRVDHTKAAGTAYEASNAEDEGCLIRDIVERWPHPDQVLDGIEEIQAGVWTTTGAAPPEDTVCIGPLWLGGGTERESARCLVGPRWTADQAGTSAGATCTVTVRPIAEVTVAESSGAETSAESGQLYPLLKRSADVAVSLGALICMSPLMAVIAVLIVLQDGRPLFFGHRRQGRHGKPFRCWKFRTMHRNAEAIARDLAAYNVCDGPQVYIREDPRVTHLGRLLRRTHIDELPQLWNVLVGDMSLVGPRPSPDDENQFCPAWRDSRLSVRPGITGLWQLKRKREPGEDFQEWIRYDIEYVQRACMRLDLWIMIQTIRIILLGRDSRANE